MTTRRPQVGEIHVPSLTGLPFVDALGIKAATGKDPFALGVGAEYFHLLGWWYGRKLPGLEGLTLDEASGWSLNLITVDDDLDDAADVAEAAADADPEPDDDPTPSIAPRGSKSGSRERSASPSRTSAPSPRRKSRRTSKH